MNRILKACSAGGALTVLWTWLLPSTPLHASNAAAIFGSPNMDPSPRPTVRESRSRFVARSYGSNVTGAQVCTDPLMKVYLCHTLGYALRLKGSCAGYGPDSYAPAR